MRGHLLPEARALWEDVRSMVGKRWKHLSWIPEEGEAAAVHEFCEALGGGQGSKVRRWRGRPGQEDWFRRCWYSASRR